jgi:AraC-like DNA-binding protein
MMYLRRLRLHHVRAELAAHSPDSVTVTMVAGRWGFVHLGRFASQYRQLFGETPSTFAQCQRALRAAEIAPAAATRALLDQLRR